MGVRDTVDMTCISLVTLLLCQASSIADILASSYYSRREFGEYDSSVWQNSGIFPHSNE